MLPLLKWASGGTTRRVPESYEAMAIEFNLNADERGQLLESGQPVLYNRVGWAKTYLTKAGLLEKMGQGLFKITEEGEKLLRTNPTKVDAVLLRQYPGYLQFKQRSSPAASIPTNGNGVVPPSQTPEEMMEGAFSEIQNALAQELVASILRQSASFFEQLVVDLLVAMGYGGSHKDAATVVGKSGDGGIDGIIKQDRLGLDSIYVQAKRWNVGHSVGRPDIQAFVGALSGNAASKGVFITTGRFSDLAIQFIEKVPQRVILIDGDMLARYMIEFSIGVSVKEAYIVKRLDSDYFEEV